MIRKKPLPASYAARRLTAILLIGLLVAPVLSATDVTPNPARAKNLALVRAQLERDLAAGKDNADLLILPGVTADRKAKSVELLAEATGLDVTEPIEYYLIAQSSGHDYEALAISFAQPSDVHRALEFIGLPAGLPVDYDATRLWPRGERVNITFSWDAADAAQSVLAQDLLIDDRTGKSPGASGFVFTGSRRVPGRDQGDKDIYAADSLEPNAVLATYNEPISVLDVPEQCSKAAQYPHLQSNPKHRMPAGKLIRVRIKPERTDGKLRVLPLTLKIASAPGGDTAPALRFSLLAATGAAIADNVDAAACRAAMTNALQGGRDIFVTLAPEPALPVAALRAMALECLFLEEHGIARIDAPRAGDLFFRAFLPNDQFRLRDSRPTQPWELHLRKGEGQLRVGLTLVNETIDEATQQIRRQPEDYAVAGAGEVGAALTAATAKIKAADRMPPPPVILTFVDGTVTYGELMKVLRPLLKEYPIHYVFTQPPQ